MIELTELHCEQICGGYRGGPMAASGRGLGRTLLAPVAASTTTATSTSLTSVFNVNPQINVAVNLALFDSSVSNTQGNGSALIVA
ncbi:MAG: hypothetical protein FJ050_00225 [Cyanobacteria bacterium M_surface_7_m2_040]|nr:hypothetical protein [Cyanobacteria bacterium K_Offshore_0m_m2_072]MBM5826487.1 hypothetical protein [Cyanobacteria bacterium M_surface_7_m2_040]